MLSTCNNDSNLEDKALYGREAVDENRYARTNVEKESSRTLPHLSQPTHDNAEQLYKYGFGFVWESQGVEFVEGF